jgi:DNA-directed RNA polymerase subunit M/transcription elongation factor TFIIS
MKLSHRRFECSKCGISVNDKPDLIADIKNRNLPQSEAIVIIEDSRKDAPEISQICPQCGNNRAFRWISTLSGEHAGIKLERTVEHYRCIECKHSWAKTR